MPLPEDALAPFASRYVRGLTAYGRDEPAFTQILNASSPRGEARLRGQEREPADGSDALLVENVAHGELTSTTVRQMVHEDFAE